MEKNDRIANKQQKSIRILLIFIIIAVVVANLMILQKVTARSATAVESAYPSSLSDVEDFPLVLDLNGPDPNHNYTATFTENEEPSPIVASTMTISASDNTMLQSALVVLTNRLDENEEFLDINTENTGLTADYDFNSGVLRLGSTGTISNYQKALSTITYNNLSESPASTDRTVTFQVFDGNNYSNEAVSTVLVEAVNDAPILHINDEFRFADIGEDDTNQFGNRVASLIDPIETGGEDRITDPDAYSLEGIAVIGAETGNGYWQISINAGSSWQELSLVSNNSATLLDPTARIRFVPNLNYHGSTSITIRAWDQTSGENGDTEIDISENGGTSAFSSATVIVTLEVLAVNDPPVPDLNGVNPGTDLIGYYVQGSGPTPVVAPQGAIEDVDNEELASVSVTLKPRPDGAYEILASDLETSRISIGPYDPGSGTLHLSGAASLSEYNEVLQSIVYENRSDNPTLVDRVVEFVASDGLDNGPTTSTTFYMLSTNTAPWLEAGGSLSLDAINEDDKDPPGNSVQEVIISSGTDPIQDDDGALRGFAIIGAAGEDGQWQYSVDAGNNWWAVGDVSDTSAVLVNAETRLRFLGDENAGDFTRELIARAWDQTSGFNGSLGVNVSQNGASTAFSTETVQVTVDVVPVNDPPILDISPGITAVFSEDDGPVNIAGPSLQVMDVDSESLNGGTVKIINHQINEADVLAASPNGSGITTSFNSETGMLSLNGRASVAAYQAVLRTVTFENRSHDPETHDRIITFIVSDVLTTSNHVSSTVKVESINDLPLVDLNGSSTPGNNVSVQFDQSDWGGTAVPIANNLDLQDLDNISLNAAAVTLLERPDGEAEYLEVNTDGTNITAVFNSTTGELQLTGIESLANYERVLRTVTYTNSKKRPLTMDRRARFFVRDHEGKSKNAFSHIIVTPKLVMMPVILNTKITLPESDEPNDLCQEAYPLNINVPYQFLAEDKDDWYSFSITSSSDVIVNLTGYEPVEGQILVARGDCDDLQLLGHNGDFATNKPVILDRLQAGRYYIWLITDNIRSSGTPFKYNLSVLVQ